MSYTINITEVTPNVTVSTVESPIGVTVENQQFNVTTEKVSFNVVNTSSQVKIFTDATELRIADLNKFFEGEWVSGTEYARGSIVTYNYSLFLLKDFGADVLALYTSTIDPNEDTDYWIRLVWHEAPFDHLDVTNTALFRGEVIMEVPLDHLTVTNHISAGSLSIGGGIDGQGLLINTTATFNGPVFINNTATMQQLILDKLKVAGIDYPEVPGEYGQVLITNGVNRALWIDLSQLVYWRLTSDLDTAGYNIMAGKRGDGTSLPLIIGQTKSNELENYIEFTDTTQNIEYRSNAHKFYGNLTVTNTVSYFDGDIRVNPYKRLYFGNGNTVLDNGGLNTGGVTTAGLNVTDGFNAYDNAQIKFNTSTYTRIQGTVRLVGTATDITNLCSPNKFYTPILDYYGNQETNSSGDQMFWFDDTRLDEYNFWKDNLKPSDVADPTLATTSTFSGSDWKNPGYWVNSETDWWQKARFASTTTAGLIKIGGGLEITEQGYINVIGGGDGTGSGTGYIGSRGYTGSQGLDGAYAGMGYTGSKGDTGNTGYIGSQGYEGPSGADGYVGSQGIRGYVGSQGLQGPAGGYTGSAGSTGFTGSHGAEGAQGYTGSQGEVGPMNTGEVDLSQPFITNGYPIEYSTATNASHLTIDYTDISLKDRPRGSINLYNTSGSYTVTDQDGVSEILLSSTATGYPTIIANGNKIQLGSSSTYISNQFYYNELGDHFVQYSPYNTIHESKTDISLRDVGLSLRSNIKYNPAIDPTRSWPYGSAENLVSLNTSSVLISSHIIKKTSTTTESTYVDTTSTVSIGETVDIISTLTNVMSPVTIFGTDNVYSTIRVNEIANYNDSGAVFITQVQFGDETIQRTAYEPDQGLLP